MKQLLLALALLAPSALHAQDLRTATTVFAIAAAADTLTTHYGVMHGALVEANPALSPIHDVAAMTAVAAGADVLGAMAWRRLVGRKHPRIAAVGLYAVAGVRVYLAAKGLRYIREARR